LTGSGPWLSVCWRTKRDVERSDPGDPLPSLVTRNDAGDLAQAMYGGAPTGDSPHGPLSPRTSKRRSTCTSAAAYSESSSLSLSSCSFCVEC